MNEARSLVVAIALLGTLAIAAPARAQAQPPDTEEEIPVPVKPAPAPVPAPAPSPLPAPRASVRVSPPPPAVVTPPPPSAGPPRSEIEALRDEMREERAKVSARIAALEAEIRTQAPAPSAAPSPWAPPPRGFGGLAPGDGVWGINAYLQSQYEQHQSSADQIGQSGAYLNQDRFLVRRGRLRLDAAWEYVELGLELDGNTTNGPAVGPTRLEATVVLRGKPWEQKLVARGPRADEVPLLRLTAGLTGSPSASSSPT